MGIILGNVFYYPWILLTIDIARPAFDCRGSVTIAFVKNSHKITIKLEHTPIHKTVAELAEIFKPVPQQARAVASNKNKKKKSQAVNGEKGSQPSKKKRKKADEPTADGQAPKPKKSRPSRAKAKAAGNGADDAVLNLSPSEAARRSDEARRKLSDSGVDPDTLSQEQFDIFSNQSPELQTESLAMLVKYGAEKLRIVHPNKDDGASANPAAANGDSAEGSKKKKKRPSSKSTTNPDGTPKEKRVKKTRGACQGCRAKKLKCGKAKPACAECVEAGIECYYPPQESRKPKSDARAEDEPDQSMEPDAAEHAADLPADMPADVVPHHIPDLGVPQPEPAPVPEEDNSDLGSPGFNSSQHVDAPTFPEVSHDLYQPSTSGLTYPSAVQDDIGAGMDYAAYSNQIGHQQAAQSGMAYPQQSQQTSNATYHDSMSAPPAPPAPEPVQPVQAPAAPAPPNTSRTGNRRSLPSGSAQNANAYSNIAHAGNGTAWQAANAPASTSQAYAAPVSPRQSRTGRKAAPAAARAYDTSQNDALAAAATLSQAALRQTQPSPTTRTVSPFQNPTQAAAQAARVKSRQGHRSQSRATASPFQQASSTQPAAVDTASIYNTAGSAEPATNSNYDQYPRYNTATPQNGPTSARGAYDTYPQQQSNASNSSTSYAGYDGYNARSQASSSTPLAAPATHNVPASYTKKAAPAAASWSNNSTGHRSNNSYGSNKVAASSNSAYGGSAASTQQQQSASMQSFNVRPPPAAQTSRTHTPASYNAQQQPAQQSRQQQQQAYNSSYSSQPHSSSTQPASQAQQQQQQQQDWYGFGSSASATPGYGSGSRGAGYGQSAQQRPAAMNISGSTYQSMHDQEVYDMFRHPPAH